VQTLNFDAKSVNCRYCSKPNPAHQVVCHACGRLLMRARQSQDMQAIDTSSDRYRKYEFFGESSVLNLRVSETGKLYEVYPQKSKIEVLIGRVTNNSNPDVDLGDQGGDKRGVSRVHLSVRYDSSQRTISVIDLSSANGTFINGQRLYPNEVRILRHNDELRLGKLVLNVSFSHVK
jgi:FHA domain